MSPGRLDGKRAVVTGAARGNGLAFARAFAQEGAYVLLADFNAASLEAGASSLAEIDPKRVSTVTVDVSVRSQVESMIETAVDQFGGIDICVNNAGILTRRDVLDITEDDWDRVIDVNLKGTFLCAQAAARAMVADSGGSIINIASINVVSGGPLTAHYSASKGGVMSLTKAMAVGLAGRGVRVNAIAPGPVDTEMSSDRREDPAKMAATVARVPLGRVAQPEDLTGAALFLASDDAAFVTGTTVFVDGGWTAR